ncbi:hypothetical protein AAE478_005275 [Parahypoxylon ruwenzoriense]
MGSREYTRLDRGNVLKTLEARLSVGQTSPHGPQVQLFRVSSVSGAPPPPPPPPISTMSDLNFHKEPRYEGPSEQASVIKPAEDLVQMYSARIQAIEAVISQLRVAERERRNWEYRATTARQALESAEEKISGLEERRERDASELKNIVEQRDAHRRAAEEAGDRCRELEDANRGLAEQLESEQKARLRASNEVVRLHHVVWGAEAVRDAGLEDRLLDCAARGVGFRVTREFVGRYGEDGEGILIVAYSAPPEEEVRWMVVREGEEGRFGVG